MQLYSAKVRLSGSLYNEVSKSDLTAAEITVLRLIHRGDDSVVEIKPTGNVNRSDSEERDRLQQVYGKALSSIEGIKNLNAVLGVPGVPLPQMLPGFEAIVPAGAKRVRKADPAPEPIDQETDEVTPGAPEFA